MARKFGKSQHPFTTKSSLLCLLQILASPARSSAHDEPTATTTVIVPATEIYYPSSTSTPVPITSPDRWVIPLVGLSDVTTPWGANVTSGNGTVTAYTISVGQNDSDIDRNGGENGTQPLNRPQYTLVDAQFIGDLNGNQVNFTISQHDHHILNLGNDSHLMVTTSGTDENTPIRTVPFGLNLGHRGEWNGSLALGGLYDANRLTDDATSWVSIAETMNNNGTFLQTGKQTLSAVILRVWEYNPGPSGTNTSINAKVKRSGPFSVSDESEPSIIYPARLDLTSDALILPRDWCGRNVTLEINMFPNRVASVSSSILIGIPGNLTDSSSRCSFEQNTEEIVLGRPFFQAAYIYVDVTGEVRILPANQYDLPPKPVSFNASARLVQPDRRTSRYSPGAAGGTLVKGSWGDRNLPAETALNRAVAVLLVIAGFAFLL
ncbi:hypothetical protein IFM58399_08964 [Aspergillus lentulus]|uniref:Peptidase A1 domain-containing protein n=1 Tax=Aspergillus lentulus TaxID=293939 RepID=A0ABQ1AZ77_ASPLE|nr:uncharacterized protein IFM58399_08964 [Aspergillus lentulus]KAF4157137.1 hypothetical protein CNMCM6069_005909 [Aspergillus lentulus]KAF4166217.1 hypothetical protein CNMCM6936_006738 [Aspergillus lentulus]KAF4179360.1 hypothetical protein CNMCM8060_003223 [Aspergillus lentulus]KAF4182651.1 hypothetical protein CNMCM7927_009513 [Aspergillus lentulus]KAF4198752.1 hypothetical protein CNMCM8694_008102 [Aspergillus lentulus]